ncbi:hypothetical protein PENTCL1PPCAC_12628, partial [Pristionchus entomophagus]
LVNARRMRALFVLLCIVIIDRSGAAAAAITAAPDDPPRRVSALATTVVDCAKLHPYKFQCYGIDYDKYTNQPADCNPDNSIPLNCTISLPGIVCIGNTTDFTYALPDGCRYGAKAYHSSAMLLSLFFGLLGLDRFYLGYYTIGLIKLCSMGGLFILYFIDIVLIALQILEPADGSGYIMQLWGPRAFPVRFNNQTLMIEDFGCVDCR